LAIDTSRQSRRSRLAAGAAAHYAALDGGSVTLALATAIDHPIPGQAVVGIKTDDVDGAAKAIEDNGLVFYKSLPRD